MKKMKTYFKVKTIITPFTVIKNGSIGVDYEGKICYIGPPIKSDAEEVIEADNLTLIPGFIDLHIHGSNGYDIMEGNDNKLFRLTEFLASKGVTSFLPTTTTSPMDDVINAIASIKRLMEKKMFKSKIIGAHIEGPYFNPVQSGAQDDRFLRKPSVEEMKQILDMYKGVVKRVTLAPELEGGSELIKFLRSQGIIVAMGHTDATYDEAIKAINYGATIANHLFNRMRKIHHREPGVIVACLDRDDVYTELIVDGIHIHPAVLRLVVKAKTTDKIILITDAIMAAGLADGEYMLGRQRIIIKDGKSTLEDGVTIAGSTLTMDRAVRNAVEMMNISLKDAVKMASYVPALALGLADRKGAIKLGYDADIVLIDDQLNVKLTMREGEIIYNSM